MSQSQAEIQAMQEFAFRAASQPTKANIRNAYKKAREFTQRKNRHILSHKKENILQYLNSRSCYKQFIRMVYK